MAAFALELSLAVSPRPVFAEADGPDFYRVVDVSADDTLNVRAGPSTKDAVVGTVPHDADGLRNLGCKGELGFAEWQKVAPHEREAAKRRRWCRIDYKGLVGWVAGWHVAEGSGGTAAPSPIVGPVWKLVGMLHGPAYGDARMTLAADGHLSGNSGCNAFQGSAKLGSGTLDVAPLATTRKACAETEVMAQEARLLSILSGELQYEIAGDRLTITAPSDGATLTFAITNK